MRVPPVFVLLLAICSNPAVAGEQIASVPARSSTAYHVYVTNEGSGDISVLDPVTLTEVRRISIGKRPRGLVASPDGRKLYVAVSGSPAAGPGVDESKLPAPDRGADGIAVIDLATSKVERTLRGISDPEQIAISPDGTRLYVASEDTGRLVTIGTDGTILQSIAVGGEPEGLAVSPDGAIVLATSEEDHTVTVLTKRPLVVSKRIVVGERPRNATFVGPRRAVVPGEFDATLSVVDVVAGTRVKTITLAKSDRPMGVVRLDDHQVLVTTGRGGRVVRVDIDAAATKAVTGSVAVGPRPWGLALSEDRLRAFTANGPSDDVTVVDPVTMTVIARVKVGTGPWGVIAVPRTR